MATRPVNIPITATNQTDRAFNSVQANLKGLRNAANVAGKAVVAVGGAAVAAMAALTRESMKNIDALAKTADKIGITAQALAGLQHAGEITGVSTEKMNMALQRMTRRVAEAAKGTGEAKGALEEMGLSAAALKELPIDQQMVAISQAMGNVGSQADRVRLAMKLFDSEGVALVNTLALGAAGLTEMAAEADKLGLAVSRVDAAQIESANDAVTRAKGVFTGLGNQLAIAFSPVIQGVADSFRQAALDSAEFGNIGQKTAQVVVKAFGHIANAMATFKALWISLKIVVAEYFAFVFDMLSQGATKFDGFAQGLVDTYNQLAEFFGGTKISLNLGEELGNISSAFKSVSAGFQEELDAILNGPLPSDNIDKWYEELKVKARQAAEVVAKNAPGTIIAENFEENAPKVVSLSDMNNQTILSNMSTLLSTTQTQMGQLGQIFDQGTAMGKAFYLINQTMAAGMSIINGYKAAGAIKVAYAELAAMTMNPALASVGDMHASMAIGMGYANAGAIMGQALASFEGGGYTGSGVRAGGLDGKGGFMAMVHPNETVIDHTKGQSAQTPVNVSINVTSADTRDFDRLLTERRGMIVSLVNKAINNRGRGSLA